MASLTAAETTIRRTLPCSHLLNRKDIRDSHGYSAVGKALGAYATSCQLAPGRRYPKDTREEDTTRSLCLPEGPNQEAYVIKVARGWGGGALACGSTSEHQSGELCLGGELLHAGAIFVPRIIGRHVSRRLQLLDAVIARFVNSGYRMGGTIQS